MLIKKDLNHPEKEIEFQNTLKHELLYLAGKNLNTSLAISEICIRFRNPLAFLIDTSIVKLRNLSLVKTPRHGTDLNPWLPIRIHNLAVPTYVPRINELHNNDKIYKNEQLNSRVRL